MHFCPRCCSKITTASSHDRTTKATVVGFCEADAQWSRPYSGSVSTLQLTLIGKPGCHLCDDARAVLDAVVAALPADAPTITREELSILDDPELHDRHWEEIPVVLIDGKVHNYWRIDPDRLRAAILTR